jgi:hypothetical protein
MKSCDLYCSYEYISIKKYKDLVNFLDFIIGKEARCFQECSSVK